jgi:hypothetical protein
MSMPPAIRAFTHHSIAKVRVEVPPSLANKSSVMSTVAEIKSAIEQLPLEQRAALVAELCGWTDDDWDRQ